MLDEARLLVERERLPQYQPQVPPLPIPQVNLFRSIVQSLILVRYHRRPYSLLLAS